MKFDLNKIFEENCSKQFFKPLDRIYNEPIISAKFVSNRADFVNSVIGKA